VEARYDDATSAGFPYRIALVTVSLPPRAVKLVH
jgi:hypothetical protein